MKYRVTATFEIDLGSPTREDASLFIQQHLQVSLAGTRVHDVNPWCVEEVKR